jgi:hypothetical protein
MAYPNEQFCTDCRRQWAQAKQCEDMDRGIGDKMDANAIGFASALPIFVLLVVALAMWLQRQTG